MHVCVYTFYRRTKSRPQKEKGMFQSEFSKVGVKGFIVNGMQPSSDRVKDLRVAGLWNLITVCPLTRKGSF